MKTDQFLKLVSAILPILFLFVMGCPEDKRKENIETASSQVIASDAAPQNDSVSERSDASGSAEPQAQELKKDDTSNAIVGSPTKKDQVVQSETGAESAPSAAFSTAKGGDSSKGKLSGPLSARCTANGGTVSILQHKKNEWGENIAVCVFDDDSRCEQWLLYNGMCKKGECRVVTGVCVDAPTGSKQNPAGTYCRQKGGKIENVVNRYGKSGVCVFDDSTRCEQWRLFRHRCKKGACSDNDGRCDEPNSDHPVAEKDSAAEKCWKSGGQIRRVGEVGKSVQVCVFKDGSRCEKERLLQNLCAQGDCSDASGQCAIPK